MTETFVDGADRIAALLLALLPADRELVGQVLGSFDAGDLSRITAAASRMKPIAPTDLLLHIGRFLREVSEGPRIIGGPEQSRFLAESVACVEDVQEHAVEAGAGAGQPTIWERCAGVPTDILVGWMADEPAYVQAALMLQLTAEAASAFLGHCPAEEASRIVKLLPRMAPCSSIVYRVLATYVEERLDEHVRAESMNSERLVDIVSRMPPPEFRQLISELSRDDPDLARKLKDSMFDFADFSKFDLDSRRVVVERLSPDVLTESLQDAEPELAESFLSALGSRTRRMIEQELRSGAKVDPTSIASSRQKIGGVIVQLMKEGLIARPAAD